MNPSLYTSLKQRSALSGQYPTDSIINQIVQSELENEYNNLPQKRQYELTKKAEEERNREFDLNKEQMEKNRLSQTASGLGQTAVQLGTAYGMSDSHALKDAAGSVMEYFNPTTSSMSATGLAPTVGGELLPATAPLYAAPTVGETAGLVAPELATAPTATGLMNLPTSVVPEITETLAPTIAGETLAPAAGEVAGEVTAAGAETAGTTATGLGSGIVSTVASKVLPYAAIAKVGGHALEAITGQGESNVGSQFARTLENPFEVSHWAEEFNGGKELTGWTKTFKDILDPIGYITGDK
jgi:hypothetical protein